MLTIRSLLRNGENQILNEYCELLDSPQDWGVRGARVLEIGQGQCIRGARDTSER